MNNKDTVRGTEAILLVEDIPSVRTMVARMLGKLGYTVIEATNGEEALQSIALQDTLTIELVIADVIMPRMGGVELAARLQERFPGIKILLISGYADGHLVSDKGMSAGLPFLAKPFTAKELGQTVRELLDAS